MNMYTKADIISLFIELLNNNSNSKHTDEDELRASLDLTTYIKSTVDTLFRYYIENSFIKESIKPQSPTLSEDQKPFYLRPRGEKTYSLFFSNIVLFTIFRDAFYIDDKEHNPNCSYKLSFEELLEEAFLYNNELADKDGRLFDKLDRSSLPVWRKYRVNFGYWFISETFLRAIETSINQYYKDGNIPEKVMDKLEAIKKRVAILRERMDQVDEQRRII